MNPELLPGDTIGSQSVFRSDGGLRIVCLFIGIATASFLTDTKPFFYQLDPICFNFVGVLTLSLT